MSFAGKTVIVTGASKGVGLEVSRRFVAEGANVVLCARGAVELRAAADALGERALAVPTDVADNAALQALVDAAIDRFGAIHGVINNAGAHGRGPFQDVDVERFSTMVDVNLRGPIVLTRLALPHVVAAGGGFVVNVASLAGKIPLPGSVVYSSTKWGLRAFSFALAQELAGTGITVSAVSPGPIETGFILDELDTVSDITFSQAMCTADDVAQMVVECARDGRWERDYPRIGGKLATIGYLFPGLRSLLAPMLERRGRAAKERLRKRL